MVNGVDADDVVFQVGYQIGIYIVTSILGLRRLSMTYTNVYVYVETA